MRGNSLSKISEIAGLAPRDVYRKPDFIHEPAREFTTRREGDLRGVDRERPGQPGSDTELAEPQKACIGRRSASLHRESELGTFVLGLIQFDPMSAIEQVEIDMAINGDAKKAR